MKKNIGAIILARKNSKRLINKNKRLFLGKPLFLFQIEFLKKIFPNKNIFISSDDEEIIKIAKKNQIITLKRNSKFSQDNTPAEETLLEDIKKINILNKKIKNLVLIQPTNPMVETKYLQKGIKAITDKKFNSVQTYIAQKKFEIKGFDTKNIRKNTQELNSKKIETGLFWIFKIKKFLEEKNRVIKPTKLIEIHKNDYVDIDDIDDFLIAEKKLKLKYYKNTEYYYTKRKSIKNNFDSYQTNKQVDPDGKIRDHTKEKKEKIEFYKNEINFINNLAYKKNKKILDIGCGLGYVSSAISNAYKKYGLEISLKSFNHSKKYIKNMHLGELKKNTYQKNYFDIILHLHVIEHLKNPIENLEIVYEILKPGGTLILGTPNFDSAMARKFKNKYRMLNDQTHISLFSDLKLKELLDDIGFETKIIDYPYFQTKYFDKNELLRVFDKNEKVSPPFYGNIFTMYSIKK